jgi:prevent-host-death family protein
MKKKSIDITELRETLEARLEEVREGSSMVITEEGRPVAQLVPMTEHVEERLQKLIDSGGASWNGQRLPAAVPRITLRGTQTITDLLLKDRE